MSSTTPAASCSPLRLHTLASVNAAPTVNTTAGAATSVSELGMTCSCVAGDTAGSGWRKHIPRFEQPPVVGGIEDPALCRRSCPVLRSPVLPHDPVSPLQRSLGLFSPSILVTLCGDHSTSADVALSVLGCPDPRNAEAADAAAALRLARRTVADAGGFEAQLADIEAVAAHRVAGRAPQLPTGVHTDAGPIALHEVSGRTGLWMWSRDYVRRVRGSPRSAWS